LNADGRLDVYLISWAEEDYMRSIGLLLLVSAVAFGQQHSSGAHAGPVVRSGGYTNLGAPTGNPAFPGTAPVIRGNSFSGARAYRPRTSGGLIYVPYAVGGYSYYGPGTGVDSGVDMVYPNQQGAAPMVVINQNFVPQTASPIVREYMPEQNGGIQVYPPQAPGAAQPEVSTQDSPAFLIAFKDHTIYAAVGYWVEGDTLHYITGGNTHNQVSLDLVDRELSARLNGERGVDFLLPPAHK
jgi:hypothetical protein